jgi:NAD-dependent dihydropyrimidine dehydrogenase PreA subunit
MTFVIALPCVDVKDRACVEACPIDCIYEGERMLYIHPDECIHCGACEPECPVEAIYDEADIPQQWQHFQAVNAEFFTELGAPGSAALLGPLERDHPLVAASEPLRPAPRQSERPTTTS